MKATDILMHEHELILRGVGVLDRLAALAHQPPATAATSTTSAGVSEPFALSDARALVSFLREFADSRHHAKEEAVLFPALEAAGIPRSGGPLGCMLAEHDQGRAATRVMGLALTATASDPTAWQTFGIAAQTYVRLLSAHIAKENNVLFRMATSVLTPEDDARMVGAYPAAEHAAAHDEDLHAGHDEAYFTALIATLEARYLATSAAPRAPGGDAATTL